METVSPRRAEFPRGFGVRKREILQRRMQVYDFSSLPSKQPGMGAPTILQRGQSGAPKPLWLLAAPGHSMLR